MKVVKTYYCQNLLFRHNKELFPFNTYSYFYIEIYINPNSTYIVSCQDVEQQGVVLLGSPGLVPLRLRLVCCVFQPANGCSARCSLVEIKFLRLFCSFSDGNNCFSIRKSILTSKRHAEHPFAGQNTQQL